MYTAEAEQSMSMLRRRNSDHEFVAAQAKLMFPSVLQFDEFVVENLYGYNKIPLRIKMEQQGVDDTFIF
jgi:hypothetical protein